MRWLARVFASALVRKFAYVLAALVLAAIGLDARAQSVTDTKEQAYNKAVAAANTNGPNICRMIGTPTTTYLGHNVTDDPGNRAWIAYISCSNGANTANAGTFNYIQTECPAGQTFDFSTHTCATPPDCDKPAFTTPSMPRDSAYGDMTSGSLYCEDVGGLSPSCTLAAFANPDGTWTSEYVGGGTCTLNSLQDECEQLAGFYWSASTLSCNAVEVECETGEAKDAVTGQCQASCPSGMTLQQDGSCKPSENECPAGNIKAPSGQCLPGEGQCAAGEARKPDGTCGLDANGDGEPDADTANDESDDRFSGGDSCSTPPTCSGGVIDCGMARIQWRIDCNTRRNENIAGGSCNAVPVCTGEKCSAMEYSQLLMQWRATCALEKLNTSTPGEGEDDELVSSGGVLGEDLDPNSVITEVGEDGANGIAFDTSGKGWASSCPQPPTVTLPGGESLTFDTAVFCDWMNLGGIFVMIMAHLAGLAIVVRS